MNQLVVINLGSGTLSEGCHHITADILSDPEHRPSKRCLGSLPPAPELADLHRNYRLLYAAFYGWHSDVTREITLEKGGLTHFSRVEFHDVCQQLERQMNAWLGSQPFRPIYQSLCQQLQPADEIQLILETDDPQLRQLPWQLWDFFANYPKAELALSTQAYGQVNPQSQTPKGKVRILAIFGNSEGLDLDADRKAIATLPGAEVVFLESPTRRHLNEQLWDKQGWDILFFAGHSRTDEGTGDGELSINDTDRLSLSQLKHALTEAISRGLTLAIFNSCNGLGLARGLADLGIPQVMVMREMVPDVVAQAFFKAFLEEFADEAEQQSLYLAVRKARTRLEGWEDEYPCATWLPVICQNPTTPTKTWEMLRFSTLDTSSPAWLSPLIRVLVTSMVATVAVMGIRQFGLLQGWELDAYDHLLTLRPEENPDQRIIVITIDDQDLDARPIQKQGADSLPDSQLLPLLNKLKPARAIGLDIYRPPDQKDVQPEIAQHLSNNNNFFAICQAGEPGESGIAGPPKMPLKRQGFSDAVLDSPGILRRHLLAMDANSTKCKTSYALSTVLASHYLSREKDPETHQKITLAVSKQGEFSFGNTRINRLTASRGSNAIFKLLNSRRGAYQHIATDGIQTLLNYRFHGTLQDSFYSLKLREVLDSKFNPEIVKDKIVLIGVSSGSGTDMVSTPYSNSSNPHQRVPGVFLQAQLTSQLISAALDGRPLLTFWPLWGDILWVWGWSVAGGLLIWFNRHRPGFIGGGMIILGGSLSGLCLGLLIQGQWVPLVPAALAISVTGVCVGILAASNQRQKFGIND